MDVSGSKNGKQLHALNFLKVFAILLVFNSHCSNLYPNSAMATGGALGNSLFFILSGYFLTIRVDKFFPWIRKRFLQLYPGMWIVSIINALVLHYAFPTWKEAISLYIFPTGYWFVGGLLLFNIVIWFLEKYKLLNRFGVYSLFMLALYIVCYVVFIDKNVWSVEDRNFFRMIYYFYIYSLGYCLKTGKIQVNLKVPDALIGAIIGFVGNIGWKFAMVKVPMLMPTQFMCQVFCIIFSVSVLIWGLNTEGEYCRRVPERIQRGVDFWSRYSLEIYFAQRIAQRRIALGIVFPLNMVVAIAFTLVYALLLKKIIQLIMSRFCEFKVEKV